MKMVYVAALYFVGTARAFTVTLCVHLYSLP